VISSNVSDSEATLGIQMKEMLKELVTVGEVGRPHGLLGSLRARSIVSSPNRFAELAKVFFELPSGQQDCFTIRHVRAQKSTCIITLEEINSIEQAVVWVKAKIKIPKDCLEVLPAGQYYHFDLVGMEVLTETGSSIGTLEDILPTGSNDVFVVKQHGIEHLIPGTEEIVRHIDVEHKRMVIRPIEGLLAYDEM